MATRGGRVNPNHPLRFNINRVYEQFKPMSEWRQEDDHEKLLVYLPGFQKEYIKVTIEGSNLVRVRGERLVSENKWSRFQKDYQVPESSDLKGIRAKFDGGILTITMRRKIVSAPPLPATTTTARVAEPPREPKEEPKEKKADKPSRAAPSREPKEELKEKKPDKPKREEPPRESKKEPKEKKPDIPKREEPRQEPKEEPKEKKANKPNRAEQTREPKEELKEKKPNKPKGEEPPRESKKEPKEKKPDIPKREEPRREPKEEPKEKREYIPQTTRLEDNTSPPQPKPTPSSTPTKQPPTEPTPQAKEAVKLRHDIVNKPSVGEKTDLPERKGKEAVLKEETKRDLEGTKGKPSEPGIVGGGLQGVLARRGIMTEDRKLLVNVGVGILIIAALGVYVSYTIGLIGKGK